MGTTNQPGAKSPLRRTWVRIVVGIGMALLVLVLLAVLVLKTIRFRSRQLMVQAISVTSPLDGFAERLGRALAFPTIAAEPGGETDPAPFVGLRAFLEAEFPAVHRSLEHEVIGGHSLLFRWRGTDPSAAPILLMSHIDVVPVKERTETNWTHPPFSGAIVDGFLWGRGALDVKCGALGILEAVELLLGRGFQPRGDVYLALGHDEEKGGLQGNRRIAEALKERGVRLRFVLDEGGGITRGIIDGISKPVAFVGISEKGYANVRITARAEGGHASMPPEHTAVGLIAAAVAWLESNPSPPRIRGATAAMLDYLGPEMPLARRAVLANRWLTGRLIAHQFTGKPSMNALVRTTMAATVVHGGTVANVLPESAEVQVNLRLLPGDSTEAALRRIEAAVKRLGFAPDAFTCSLEAGRSEPSAFSSVDSDGFRALHRTIAEVYPGVVVSPGLSMVATDSRHYAAIADDIYRFLPLQVTADDLERIHGTDERIGVDDYARLIGFLARLIENLSNPNAVSSIEPRSTR